MSHTLGGKRHLFHLTRSLVSIAIPSIVLLRTPDRVCAALGSRPPWRRLSGIVPTDVLGLRDGAALLLREGVPALHLKVLGADASAAPAADAGATRAGGGRGCARPAAGPETNWYDKIHFHF